MKERDRPSLLFSGQELIIGDGGENIAPVPIEDHVKATCDGINEAANNVASLDQPNSWKFQLSGNPSKWRIIDQ